MKTPTLKTTKFVLFTALANGSGLAGSGLTIVNAIEREDGSGHNWNVTGHNTAGQKVTIFIQTTD